MQGPQPGSRISHFRIVSLLGRGGMGLVYLAEDERLQRLVALKVLPESLAADPTRRARLLAEARSAARLTHPNIATVYEVGEEGGSVFVAMQHIQGVTLRQILEKAGGLGLSPMLVARYARQAAEALGHAHSKGIVHRDVKPENLMVTPEGQVKVLDFGLARRYERAAGPLAPEPVQRPDSLSRADTVTTIRDEPTLTLAGTVVGTPAYMAPEQVRGHPVDPQADVFSLGVVMCELLTGRSPFARTSSDETLRAILHEEPLGISRIRSGADGIWAVLAGILEKTLNKEPSRRYPTGQELAAALTGLEAPSLTAPQSPTITATLERAPRGISRSLAFAIAGLLVAALGIIGWRMRTGDVPHEGAGSTLSGARLSPLMVGVGLDQTPAFSPDGSRVVFSRNDHLFVVPAKSGAAGTEPGPLTSGEGAQTEPAWSPDGTTIAYTHQRSDGTVEVRSIPAAGGESSRVVLGASSPSWSPDGQRLAFVQRGLGRSSTVLTVQADGRWSRPVTRSETAFFHTYPAWSPDGRSIAFVKDPGGGSTTEIWVAPADGSAEPRQLTREAEGIYSTKPTWMPDGRWIVYVSNRGGTRNLWRIPSSGGEPVRLTAGAGEDDDPRSSPDGRRIVFTIARNSSGLFTWDLAASAERTVVLDPVAVLWGPAFSPDGRSVAYTRIDKSGPWDLYIADAGGGAPRRIASLPTAAVWPRYSPDGNELAFCSFGKGDDDVFVIPAGGGPTRRLTQGDGDDWWPTWAPDGQSLVFARTVGDRSFLYRVPSRGGEVSRLSDESLAVPDFSPDGRMLAVARNRSFRNGVGILPLDGGELRWLTDTGGWPVFRPDGQAIGFVRLEPGDSQSLWEVPVTGGEPRRIEGPRFAYWNFPFDYSPDGRRLVYTNNLAVESDLWMMELP